LRLVTVLTAVKEFRRYLYSFWHNTRAWSTDRQKDGRTNVL